MSILRHTLTKCFRLLWNSCYYIEQVYNTPKNINVSVVLKSENGVIYSYTRPFAVNVARQKQIQSPAKNKKVVFAKTNDSQRITLEDLARIYINTTQITSSLSHDKPRSVLVLFAANMHLFDVQMMKRELGSAKTL